MIITLTLNPAVDKTVFVRPLRVGGFHRVGQPQLDPAGKGINVARVAHRLEHATLAFGILAGHVGDLAASALAREGVLSHFLYITGETRLNVNVFDEATGLGTKFLDEGPHVSQEDLAVLRDRIIPWLRACRVLVLAGRLPPGAPPDTYAEYVQLCHSLGVQSVLDADDEPMRLGVKARPCLIKPNVQEAERLLGRPLPDLTAVVEAAQELASTGVHIVVISMGDTGAVCAHAGRLWRAVPPNVKKRSTVGSGDSMVAGLAVALADGRSVVDGLRLGTAAGAATAMTPGTALGSRQEIQLILPQVKIEELG